MATTDYPDETNLARLFADYKAQVYENLTVCYPHLRDHFPTLQKGRASMPAASLLVVDDNADDWALIKRALRLRFSDADPVWLADSEAVLPYLDACQLQGIQLPRLLLVDLYLPTLQQGLLVLRRLKSHPRYQLIPTIVQSWSDQSADIVAVFSDLADGYLVKPIRYSDWQQSLGMLDAYWYGRPQA